jgi:hypothetical protein
MRLAQPGVRRGQDGRHDGPTAARGRRRRPARVGDVSAIGGATCRCAGTARRQARPARTGCRPMPAPEPARPDPDPSTCPGAPLCSWRQIQESGGCAAAAIDAQIAQVCAQKRAGRCSRQLPGRCAEAGPVRLRLGLAGGPELAAVAGGGMNAVMGVDHPAGPGGDSGAAGIGGPLAAAPVARARSGSAPGEPCAGREAAGEPVPGTGQGVAGGAGGPPEAAGEESQDEPFVSGDDGEGLPAAQVAAGGASTATALSPVPVVGSWRHGDRSRRG